MYLGLNHYAETSDKVDSSITGFVDHRAVTCSFWSGPSGCRSIRRPKFDVEAMKDTEKCLHFQHDLALLSQPGCSVNNEKH